MLRYDELKTNPRKFVSLSSLTPEEFTALLPAFERAYLKKYPASKTKTGKARKRKAGAGRKGALASIEQKLLFALVYQKSYPLQSVMGELFGIGQSQANEWIHDLLPILKQALDDLGFLPERDPQKFKKKIHRDKNVVIATVKRKRVSYLSQTYPGKTHDKKVADTENISFPTQLTLHQDTGFQGYEPKVRRLYQPKKSRARRN